MAARPAIIKHFKIKAFSASLAVAFALGFSLLLFKLHVPNSPSHAATSCTVSSNLINPCRPWFGAAARGNLGTPTEQTNHTGPKQDLISQFDYLQNKLIGHQLDIWRQYDNCNASSSGGTVNCNEGIPFAPGSTQAIMADRSGTYADLNWKPGKWKSADGVANGGSATVDNEIKQVADNIKKLNKKVFLTVWHEPENDVSAWDSGAAGTAEQNYCTGSGKPANFGGLKGAAGTPDQYKTMWANVQNIFKQEGTTNVVWVYDTEGYSGTECLIPELKPANNVSWWVTDVYGHNHTFQDTAGRIYGYVKTNPDGVNFTNLPAWGLGEFDECNSQTGDGVTYFDSAKTAFDQNSYPKYKMWLVYADTGNGAGTGCLTDYDAGGETAANYDTAKQKAFNALALDILNHGSGGQPSPSVSIASPASGATVKGTVSVSATASVSSGSITKVVLSVGGKGLKTCTSSPCTSAWNTTKYSNGATILKATATATDGKTASASENVTVNNAPPPPSVPVNITSPSQTTTSINLSWSASTDASYPASQISYHIFRNGVKVGTTGAGATTYTDKDLAPGTYYSYTVNAGDPAGRTSAQSAAFTQNTKTPDCAKPKAPQGLSGTANSPTDVSLHWQAVANPSSTCVILHYVVSRDSVPIAQPGSTSYADSSLAADTAYTYTVLAVETGNIAGPSSSVSVTTPKPTATDPGPTAPANVKSTAISTSQINLSWSASTDSVSGIKLYEIIRNGSQVGTATTTSFGDSGLSASTTYTYRVVAVSGGDKTASSATVRVTTLKPGGNPGGGNSGGSGNSSASIPILKGTHSVGSGSDTGQSTTQNPTAGNPNTGNSNTTGNNSTGSTGIPNQPAKSSSFKTVVYVGGGILILLALLGLGMWKRHRNRIGDWGQPVDADLTAHVNDVQPGGVVKPEEPGQPDSKKDDGQNNGLYGGN